MDFYGRCAAYSKPNNSTVTPQFIVLLSGYLACYFGDLIAADNNCTFILARNHVFAAVSNKTYRKNI